EGDLARHEVEHVLLRGLPRLERRQVVIQPATVRLLRREPPFDAVVLLQATALRIDTDHLARSELAASDAAVPVDVDRAGFRGAGDQAVLADRVAQRP